MKYDYSGTEMARAEIDKTDADDAVLMAGEPADSWPGCGRGVELRETEDGDLYIKVDLGNETQFFAAREDAEGCIDTPYDLLSFLVSEDADVIERASVYGSDAITEAGEDASECNIIVAQDWYGPNETYGWYSEDDRNMPWVGSYVQAAQKIKELEDDRYVLAHNEAGRPEYYIVEA